AFLRVLNAAANVQSVKKQLTFVRDHSGPANARLLTLALADVEDALQVLAQPGRQLAPSAKHALDTLALIVKQTAAQPAAGQAAYAAQGLIWCQVFFDATFRANPNQDFVTE
ncbi:MAG TPA: hypothetical protein VLC09_10910, partial [Polyangiaceae bacterium]|nr:hypothetical protein [Polyangiaceae bacterium]